VPNVASELVRLDGPERELIFNYRRCNAERQGVLQSIAVELSQQTRSAPPPADNVVLITRKLR
jgi:hypothetical protein